MVDDYEPAIPDGQCIQVAYTTVGIYSNLPQKGIADLSPFKDYINHACKMDYGGWVLRVVVSGLSADWRAMEEVAQDVDMKNVTKFLDSVQVNTIEIFLQRSGATIELKRAPDLCQAGVESTSLQTKNQNGH